jgi:2-polyprenyl-3-methyl-5-hydroxy-6-metoxy-1,4-benzoquinol methylase
MKTLDLPDIRIPGDMSPEEMPDLLRYWYLGSRARRHMMRKRFLQVDAEVAPERVGRVLDVGSAWGYNVMVLTKLGKTAIGMDLVSDPFEAGQRVAAANGLDLPVVGADASNLPFAAGEFDGVTLVETFEHIFDADREKAVAECHRVLRKGGRLVLSTPNHGSFVERFKRAAVRLPWLQRRLPIMCYPAESVDRGEYHPYRYHRPEPVRTITRLLEEQGFNILKTKYFLFVLKNTPDGVYPVFELLERAAERTPWVNRLAATVCVVGEKP